MDQVALEGHGEVVVGLAEVVAETTDFAGKHLVDDAVVCTLTRLEPVNSRGGIPVCSLSSPSCSVGTHTSVVFIQMTPIPHGCHVFTAQNLMFLNEIPLGSLFVWPKSKLKLLLEQRDDIV